jgi:hypothetical protein
MAKNLTNLPSEGTVFGQSATDKIGFYGLATPIVQPALSAAAAVVTTAVINSSVSATAYGYTSAQATSIITLVNALRAALVSLGLAST